VGVFFRRREFNEGRARLRGYRLESNIANSSGYRAAV
jgi:hypothetical protein